MTGECVASVVCSSTSCCRSAARRATCPAPRCAPSCRASLIRLAPPLCARCGAPGAWPVRRCAECSGRRLAFATARAAILYDEPARRLVLAWKERGLRRLAPRRRARRRDAGAARQRTSSRASRPTATGRSSAATPRRGGSRGSSGGSGSCRSSRCCGGRGRSERQRGLGLAERRRNVRGAFAPARASPTRVCLVDDVYTSGATATAAASALRKGGARHVEVVTLARAVR